jgi:hypothetical protein
MTNTDRAAYFGTLAADAMTKGLVSLATGYATLAAHWGRIYLTNSAVCRAS